jgi:hypothetical protein
LAIYLSAAALGCVSFVWPLLGVHRLLEEDKQRRLRQYSQRMEAAIQALHERLDSGNLQGMPEFHRAMACLEIEQSAVERIPTWPWQQGTLRGMALGLFLPTAVWLIQLILQRLLG